MLDIFLLPELPRQVGRICFREAGNAINKATQRRADVGGKVHFDLILRRHFGQYVVRHSQCAFDDSECARSYRPRYVKTHAWKNFGARPRPAPLSSEHACRVLRTSRHAPPCELRQIFTPSARLGAKIGTKSAKRPPQTAILNKNRGHKPPPMFRNTWVLILRPFCVFITTYAEYFTKNKKSDGKAAKHRFGSRLHRGIRRAARLSALLALLPAGKLKFLLFL